MYCMLRGLGLTTNILSCAWSAVGPNDRARLRVPLNQASGCGRFFAGINPVLAGCYLERTYGEG